MDDSVGAHGPGRAGGRMGRPGVAPAWPRPTSAGSAKSSAGSCGQKRWLTMVASTAPMGTSERPAWRWRLRGGGRGGPCARAAAAGSVLGPASGPPGCRSACNPICLQPPAHPCAQICHTFKPRPAPQWRCGVRHTRHVGIDALGVSQILWAERDLRWECDLYGTLRQQHSRLGTTAIPSK